MSHHFKWKRLNYTSDSNVLSLTSKWQPSPSCDSHSVNWRWIESEPVTPFCSCPAILHPPDVTGKEAKHRGTPACGGESRGQQVWRESADSPCGGTTQRTICRVMKVHPSGWWEAGRPGESHSFEIKFKKIKREMARWVEKLCLLAVVNSLENLRNGDLII